MTQNACTKIEKLNEKLASLKVEKQKLELQLEGLLLSTLKTNGAFDMDFPILLGALKTTLMKLKTNAFSDDDLKLFEQLGNEFSKKTAHKKPSRSPKKGNDKKAA